MNYCDEGKTINEIANIIGCFPSTVARALKRNFIQTRFEVGEPICQKEESDLRADGSERYLSVDHDHKTGKTRQLLCRKCNLIIGLAKDDCTVLKSAIEYLEKHNVCISL